MPEKLIHTIVIAVFFVFFTTGTAAQEQAPVVSIDSVALRAQADQDSENFFSLISDSSSIKTRSIPDSTVKKLKADEDYWYANTVPERQKRKEVQQDAENQWYQKPWFASLLWFLIIGAFVAILIWFLASSNIKLFRKKPLAGMEENEEITEETIFSLPFEKEIQKAIADENYRLAIRLWYLYVLKELAERNLIQYRQEKTNSDYVNELYETSYYNNFFRLTRHFEYTWYGKFELPAAAFALLQKEFLNFKQELQP